MRELGEAELSSDMLAFPQLTPPPLTVLTFWLASYIEKPSVKVLRLIKELVGWPQLDMLACKRNRTQQNSLLTLIDPRFCAFIANSVPLRGHLYKGGVKDHIHYCYQCNKNWSQFQRSPSELHEIQATTGKRSALVGYIHQDHFTIFQSHLAERW